MKKITIGSEFNVAKGTIVQTVAIAVILYLLDTFIAPIDIWIMIAILLAISLPTTFLHLYYAYRDKEKRILITERSIVFMDGNVEVDLNGTNKIVIKGSVALTRKVIPIFISPAYHDIVFKSDDFEEVMVSSLLDVNLRKIVLAKFDNKLIEYDHFFLY